MPGPRQAFAANPQLWAEFLQRFSGASAPGSLPWLGFRSPTLEQAIWAGLPSQHRRAVWKIVCADVPRFLWEEPNGPMLDPLLSDDIEMELCMDFRLGPDQPRSSELLTKVGRILRVFVARSATGRFAEGSAQLLLQTLQVTQGDEAEAYAIFHRLMETLQVFTTHLEPRAPQPHASRSDEYKEDGTGNDTSIPDSQLHTDALMLAHFLVADLPQLTQHLDRFRFDVTDLLEIMQQWLGNLFSGCLQRHPDFALRAIDLTLFGYHRSLWALVYGLMKAAAPSLLQLDDADGLFQAMSALGQPLEVDAIGEQSAAAADAVVKLAAETGWLDLLGNSARARELETLRHGKSWAHVCSGAGPVLFVPGVGSPGNALQSLESERSRRQEAEQQRNRYLEQLASPEAEAAAAAAGRGSFDSLTSSSSHYLFGISEADSLDGLGPLSPDARSRIGSRDMELPSVLLTPAQQQRGSSATWSSRRPASTPGTPGHQSSLSALDESRRPSTSAASSSGGTLPRGGGGGLGARASRMGTLFGSLYHRPRISQSNFLQGGPGSQPDLEPLLESLQSVLQQQQQPVGGGADGGSLGEQQRQLVQTALDSLIEYQASLGVAQSDAQGAQSFPASSSSPAGTVSQTPGKPQPPQQLSSVAVGAQPATSSRPKTTKMVEVLPDGGILVQLPGEKSRIQPPKKAVVPEDGIVKHSALDDYLSFPCLYMEGLLLKARGKKHNIGLFGNKNLQLRFFVLQGRFLSYFRSKDSRKPNKDISLDMRGRKILVLKHHEFGQNGFQINRANGAPALLLFADTQHIRDVWVSVLQSAAQLPD